MSTFFFTYEITFLLALFGCLSLLWRRFVLTAPSFSLLDLLSPTSHPTCIDRVSLNRSLKARHEADSFEPAEWSEQLTSRKGVLARRCRRRIDPRCFLHFLLFLSSSFLRLHFSSLTKLLLSWRFSAISLLSSAGSSLLLSLCRFFTFFLPLPIPHRPCQSEPWP